MRKLLVFFSMAIVAGMMAVNLTSCGGDDPMPMPTVSIDVQKDGHTAIIAVQSSDATSFAWTYGDQTSSTVTGTHEHEYEYSGTYTITVTVTNESGTATDSEEVVIDPEPIEILAGTPESHPSGKTWILDPTYYPGKNGAGPIIPEMPVTQDFLMDNILEILLGLGEEYDNEFTFKYDGSLMIDNKNGVSLGGTFYSYAALQTGPAAGFEGGSGISGMNYTPVPGGTYELKQEDINMDVVIEDPADLGAGWEEGTLSLTDQMIIEPTDYFGFLDFTKTVVVDEITSEYMHLIFFMHGVVEVPSKPSTAIHITVIPKQ